MKSPNPYSQDDLDHLVRGALKARVSDQTPPDRVWDRIKLELETQKSPPPRRVTTPWSPVAVQVALTLLIVIVGGLGLRTVLDPGTLHDSSRGRLPPASVAYVDERPASPGMTVVSVEADVRLLQSLSRPDAAPQTDSKPDEHPPLMVPPDAPAHPLSPGGHLLEPESAASTHFFVTQPLGEHPCGFGGPYEH
jgi:hypothetical protein